MDPTTIQIDISQRQFVFLMAIAGNKKALQKQGFFLLGGSGETRTRDQRIKSPLL
jgi:hypothetical protein